MLTVISEESITLHSVKKTSNENYDRKRYYVKCLCDCGNYTFVDKCKISNGVTTSCGCKLEKVRKGFGSRLKLNYGESAFNETYGVYKKNAELRGYSFELTKEQFKEIITKPCIYCGENLTQTKIKPKCFGNFKYTGIDRYDNTKGYTLENAVPCCAKCNRIKTDMNIEEFENRLTTILNRKDFWKRVA